ncbi:hypothetical protein [Kordiimonas aquimaris]|uniref:hypothetical protein n=1 Tax=Kordiimonas aquimaris TaxID=707591 RepID=UPI0021D17CED|nr:hypothetical protein [Kordiimonas aquimaris]
MIKYLMRPLTGLALMAATAAPLSVSAQDSVPENTYTFEAGQVIDFLFLTQRPNTEDAYNAYAKDVISEGIALDYKPIGGFRIDRKPTQGNAYPQVLVFGSWPGDFKDRADALESLEAAVPSLHERRLDVWSRFDMINYELDEDKSFTVRRDKIQVLTAYWEKDTRRFNTFIKEFMAKAKAGGGVVKLELTNPRSPFGYDYTPEHVTITEWDNQAAFDAFLKQNLAMDHAGVKHVNQFYLTPPTPRS